MVEGHQGHSNFKDISAKLVVKNLAQMIIIEENSKSACGEVTAKALLHLIKDKPELSNKLVQS